MGDKARFSIGTFAAAGSPSFPGLVIDEQVVALEALAPLAASLGQPLVGAASVQELLQEWPRNFATLSRIAELIRTGGAPRVASLLVPAVRLQVQAPVPQPRQIYCSGANYRKHVVDLIIDQKSHFTEKMSAEERRAYGEKLMDERAAKGKPFVFFKASSAVVGPYDSVVLPRDVSQPDWELELGVVIGRPARRVPRAEALDYVAGYVVVNDITSRELVYRPDVPQMGMDWMASKSSPTFLPMGPYLVPATFVGNPQDLRVTLKLNGETMQDESTADMIFDVARLIEFISSHVQLLPGDVICTGSPAGNGTHYNRFLRPGDVLEGSITGLGTQRNPCIAEEG
ncbi:fumarylacetoacetate hydrolase family protein [Archangium violaceum]|uniref:fumarylacetoacetate hydrolase family protein n=1 Tax=Archangium violaceum TaxID=83451 RepID=UPI00193C3627|nr:fumarylacetoacetate hydrolase family protein [Archangium violaceum]QRK06862.1 fumarylacetoacetate hydrolase family protein [Archangium violaceum]